MGKPTTILDKAAKHLMAGRFAEALKAYRQILDNNPDNAAAYRGLATLSLELGKPDSAAGLILRALSIDPDDVAGQNIFTRVLGALETPEDVGQLYFEHSRDLKAKGRSDQALMLYRKALRFNPAFAGTDDHSSARLLSVGDLENGWMAYEWRDSISRLGPFSDRLWNGEDLSGKTILIWGEQGIGDHMMFSNCLPDIIEQAGCVILETDQRLVPLFARTFPDVAVHGTIRFDDDNLITGQNLDWLKSYPAIDFFVFLGSLPRFLRPTIESFPKAGTRLLADTDQTAGWRKKLAACGPDLKVGVSWRSLRMTRETSGFFPSLENWRPLFSLPGIQFINLQAGWLDSEVVKIGKDFGVDLMTFDELDLIDDLDGTASLIGAVDSVIAAGSNIQWMGASLNVPTWTVVKGGKSEDWALLGQDRYPWFPDLKIHFAESDSELTRIFENVADEVERLADHHFTAHST